MIRLKWLVIIALFCAADAYSESKWIRMQSPNFEAYSSAGERETRDALRYFERVRDFFLGRSIESDGARCQGEGFLNPGAGVVE